MRAARRSLPQDTLDRDQDGDTVETLPLDLGGADRCYADENLDGVIDGDPRNTTADPEPCAVNHVDLGAYEAVLPGWQTHRGEELLDQGRVYRLGFHAETNITSTVTVNMALSNYAALQAVGTLVSATTAYQLALDGSTTPAETLLALLGLEQVTWEQATGALLQGNDWMVRALDLTDAEDIAAEITDLQHAAVLYGEAADKYLGLIQGNYAGFAASQVTRSSPLTATLTSYEDVDRLTTASARRSRAGLEIAERQFRAGSIDDARDTLSAAWTQADVELALVSTLWPGVTGTVAYQDLQRSMSDMGRLSEFIVTGKNALGYSPAWIPIHYRASLYPKTNFEQTSDMAEQYVGWAEDKVDLARAQSRLVDDNYVRMQDRYRQIID